MPKAKPEVLSTVYEQDFYQWTEEAAKALRSGDRLNSAERELIAQEIEDMGKSDLREVKSRTRQLMMHLLKWVAQPDKRSTSWKSTIVEQRNAIKDLLDDSPSLRYRLQIELDGHRLYAEAVESAAIEIGIPESKFPKQCPFSLGEILDRKFWPDVD